MYKDKCLNDFMKLKNCYLVCLESTRLFWNRILTQHDPGIPAQRAIRQRAAAGSLSRAHLLLACVIQVPYLLGELP